MLSNFLSRMFLEILLFSRIFVLKLIIKNKQKNKKTNILKFKVQNSCMRNKY